MSTTFSRRARRPATLLLAALLSTLFSVSLPACTASTPQLEQRFGAAVRLARAGQIANPGAVINPDPVAGIDGRSARAALERYQKSFTEPAPVANAFTIGVSGGK